MPDYPQAAAGALIRARRVLLDTLIPDKYSSMEAFATTAGSSPRMVADAELGNQVGPKTRLRLSRALYWTDDSIDRLYRGEDPIERPDSPLLKDAPISRRDEESDELTARAHELQRRLDLIPDVYDNYGRDSAREAIKRLSTELAELLAQIRAASPQDGNSPRHAS